MSWRVMSTQLPASCAWPQMFDLDRRVADDLQKLLVVPDVVFARGDVQIADKDGAVGLVPAEMVAHLGQEIELLAELHVHVAVGNVAARGDIDSCGSSRRFPAGPPHGAHGPCVAKSVSPASMIGSFDRIATPL